MQSLVSSLGGEKPPREKPRQLIFLLYSMEKLIGFGMTTHNLLVHVLAEKWRVWFGMWDGKRFSTGVRSSLSLFAQTEVFVVSCHQTKAELPQKAREA